MGKITIIFVHRVHRKMTVETKFEHDVESEVEAEDLGRKDARILEAYMNGFGSNNGRRY